MRKKMKLLRQEIQIRRAAQRFLQKKSKPDQKRIAQLTGEIFELQRAILTKTLRVDMPAIG
jgi:hypothetical protein